MIQIIPSILVQTEKEFITKTSALTNILSMIQLDIADGEFVPNTTWADPRVVADNLEIDCELHLMVSNPVEEARKWEYVDQVKRVLVHYESVENVAEALGAINSYGWEVGIVLTSETPIEVVDKFIEEIDSVMFMSVKPGFQGQPFIPETLYRIKALRTKYPDLFIEIDGAVNENTIEDIVKSGVSAVCPGSAIVGNEREPRENVQRMRKLISKALDL